MGEYGSFGLRPAEAFERQFGETGLISSQSGYLLVVTSAGQIVGEVGYHHGAYGPNESSKVYNIGINILAEQRGNGYGTEAQQLLTVYLFETYSIMRVDAFTDRENIPEQRSLEKAGFTREGVLRQAQWRMARYGRIQQIAWRVGFQDRFDVNIERYNRLSGVVGAASLFPCLLENGEY